MVAIRTVPYFCSNCQATTARNVKHDKLYCAICDKQLCGTCAELVVCKECVGRMKPATKQRVAKYQKVRPCHAFAIGASVNRSGATLRLYMDPSETQCFFPRRSLLSLTAGASRFGATRAGSASAIPGIVPEMRRPPARDVDDRQGHGKTGADLRSLPGNRETKHINRGCCPTTHSPSGRASIAPVL